MPVGPGASNVGNNHYPYRLAFSSSYDPVYNAANYAVAIATLKPSGKDDIHNRVWWDVADNWEGVLTKEQCTPSVEIPAKWEAWKSGTMQYGFYYYSGEPLYPSHTATIYADVNHPGKYKIAPYGDGGELLLDYWTSDGSFSYDVQIVGVIDGKNVTAGCWDADQGTDHSDDPSYRGYFDSEEGCWLFMTIWRVGGSLAAYGYDAFIED